MLSSASRLDIRGSLFARNRVSLSPDCVGGLRVSSGANNIIIEGSTFADNDVIGIYLSSSSNPPMITNSIFWGNGAGVQSSQIRSE